MIHSKKQCAEMFSKGYFGNKIKTWDTWHEAVSDKGMNGKVTLRYKGLSGGGPCHYAITLHEARELIEQYVNKGMDLERFYFNDSTNSRGKLLIQGEVCQSERGLELRYTRVKKPMRQALEQDEEYTYGVRAVMLLKSYMTGSSYEDLLSLLEKYPGHVIEFSTWSKNPGNIPGRNTIVWEVRNY